MTKKQSSSLKVTVGTVTHQLVPQRNVSFVVWFTKDCIVDEGERMPPTIGERIKAIREEKGLTQKQADLENNRTKNPTTQELKQIAAALNIPWEELVVSNVLEAPLLKKDKEPMKAWCGNRYCKCNGRVPTYMK